MGGSTCLQCGGSVAGLEVLPATRSLTRPTGLSRSLITFHEKGPPLRLGPLPTLSSSRFGVGHQSPCQGVSSVRCQATAAAPPGLREKVHRSVSSGSIEDGAASSLPYSILLDQGPREEMEDEAVVVGNAHNGFVFAGVYDGHSGSAAVNYLRSAAACYYSCHGFEKWLSQCPWSLGIRSFRLARPCILVFFGNQVCWKLNCGGQICSSLVLL